MSTPKTTINDASVTDFLNTISDESKKKDAFALLDLFIKATGEQPKMWGTSIVGFGQYHYKSDRSRQEGDWMRTGFSPRKQNLTLYIMHGFETLENELEKLGKHKTSVGCLYINKLSDVDASVLTSIIKAGYQAVK